MTNNPRRMTEEQLQAGMLFPGNRTEYAAELRRRAELLTLAEAIYTTRAAYESALGELERALDCEIEGDDLEGRDAADLITFLLKEEK